MEAQKDFWALEGFIKLSAISLHLLENVFQEKMKIQKESKIMFNVLDQVEKKGEEKNLKNILTGSLEINESELDQVSRILWK